MAALDWAFGKSTLGDKEAVDVQIRRRHGSGGNRKELKGLCGESMVGSLVRVEVGGVTRGQMARQSQDKEYGFQPRAAGPLMAMETMEVRRSARKAL